MRGPGLAATNMTRHVPKTLCRCAIAYKLPVVVEAADKFGRFAGNDNGGGTQRSLQAHKTPTRVLMQGVFRSSVEGLAGPLASVFFLTWERSPRSSAHPQPEQPVNVANLEGNMHRSLLLDIELGLQMSNTAFAC